MSWIELLLPELKIIEQSIIEKPYLKQAIKEILNNSLQSKDWDLVSSSLNSLFDIGNNYNFASCLIFSRRNDFIQVVTEKEFDEDFITWFYNLSLIYGLSLGKLKNEELEGLDWVNIIPNFSIHNDGENLLNITFKRNDGEKFNLQCQRQSWLNLIAVILPSLQRFFNEPLNDTEKQLIEEMKTVIEAIEAIEAVETEESGEEA